MAIKDEITGIQHVGIPSKDLAATITLYQSLGFDKIGPLPSDNGRKNCVFLKLGNLTIETWDNEPVPLTAGAINHISINTTNINKTFADARNEHLHLLNNEIQSVSTF